MWIRGIKATCDEQTLVTIGGMEQYIAVGDVITQLGRIDYDKTLVKLTESVYGEIATIDYVNNFIEEE